MDTFLHRVRMWRGVIWRTALASAAWWFFPWWVFMLFASLLYFSQWLHSGRLFSLLLGIFFVAAFLPNNVFSGIFVAGLLFFLFGVKDLLFVERETAYEALFFSIFFTISAQSFYFLEQWQSSWELLALIILPLIFYLAGRGLLHYIETPYGRGIESQDAKAGIAIGALIVWELAVTTLLLPIHFLYQAIILFAFAYASLELSLFEAREKLTRRLVFFYCAFFTAVLVVALTASEWRF